MLHRLAYKSTLWDVFLIVLVSPPTTKTRPRKQPGGLLYDVLGTGLRREVLVSSLLSRKQVEFISYITPRSSQSAYWYLSLCCREREREGEGEGGGEGEREREREQERPNKNNCKVEGFILSYSFGVESIMMGRSWQESLELASQMASMVRKEKG
jgi:hypothetical protein